MCLDGRPNYPSRVGGDSEEDSRGAMISLWQSKSKSREEGKRKSKAEEKIRAKFQIREEKDVAYIHAIFIDPIPICTALIDNQPPIYPFVGKKKKNPRTWQKSQRPVHTLPSNKADYEKPGRNATQKQYCVKCKLHLMILSINLPYHLVSFNPKVRWELESFNFFHLFYPQCNKIQHNHCCCL